MRNFWQATLVFLLWSAFAVIVHEYISNSIFGNCATAHNQLSENQEPKKDLEDASTTKETLSTTFAITDADGNSIFNFPKGFVTNNRDGNIDISESLLGFKDSIYNYLNANQNKELLISTKHLASEVDTEKGIHLGNSRIEFLKNMLVKAGVNSDRIISKNRLSEFSYNNDGNYFDGISLTFQNSSENNIAEIEKGISNKTLYSYFAVKQFKPDRSLKAYTIELKNYLEKYPTKKVYVEGHTDNIGENNQEFGLDRANNVKKYLITQGISETIIEASSKGETEPVATNATRVGRAKNRRIEITIK